MPIIKCSTRQLTQIALNLYSKYGYHATSIDDLAKAVGIKKASVYYHYPAKEKILWHILHDIVAYEEANIFIHLYKENQPLSYRVSKFIKLAEVYFLENISNSSFFIALHNELPNMGENYAHRTKLYFEKWERAFTDLLSLCKKDDGNKLLAMSYYQRLIAGVVMRRVCGDSIFIKRVFKEVKELCA